jgi:hypothetical protein
MTLFAVTAIPVRGQRDLRGTEDACSSATGLHRALPALRIQHSKLVPPGQQPDVACESGSVRAATHNSGLADSSPSLSLDGLSSWRDADLTLTVDGSFPKLPSAIAALEAALDTWTSSVSELPIVHIRLAEDRFVETSDERSRAEHRVYFAAEGDPRTDGTLAITQTTVDTEKKQVLDGDIIIDGRYSYPDLSVTADDSPVWYDLQSVLTHELGHWFGLPEEYCNPDATMYAYTRPRETIKRDLTESDIVKAQVAYWQADNPSGQVGCSMKPGSSISSGGLATCIAAVALMRCIRRGRARPGRRAAMSNLG